MNIVIFSGGTGSIALQKGLHAVLGGSLNQHKIQVLANYYDNGLSTGVVRQVFNGNILGPSDLRKNQSTYADIIGSYDTFSGGKELEKFLNKRITMAAVEVEPWMTERIKNLGLDADKTELLLTATRYYFAQAIALSVDYADFSVANIIYAAIAAMNGNSLFAAGKIMAKLIGIPEDRVIGNSDESLFLKAVTKSRHILRDEEDIVAWDSIDDPIDTIFFEDVNGDAKCPRISEEAATAIHYADLIIFSSGTQWSSLIPTYVTEGMYHAIKTSKAKKYLVMNNVPDRDMKGLSSHDVMETLDKGKYLPVEDITTVYNLNASEEMQKTYPGNRSILAQLSHLESSKTHDPDLLAKTILLDFYKDYIESKKFAFDYDDTLVARGNSNPELSASNLKLLDEIATKLRELGLDAPAIITGNTIRAINQHIYNVDIFADGGVNKYSGTRKNDPSTFIAHTEEIGFKKCLNPHLLLEDEVIDVLVQKIASLGIHSAKIRVRGNAMVSIKPLDPEYRQSVMVGLKFLLQGYEWYDHLKIRITGRTTIDISSVGLDKQSALYDESFLKLNASEITYLGDELERGNDECMKTKAKCLPVNSVADTNAFLKMLNTHLIDKIRAKYLKTEI
ncbi:hypothetical protein RsoM2USA_1 [Ralstonia phage RsoM2USA]|nr:hypothetical protein RsoM2USA_1 [Ralstonia phage RsoM2USA]